MTTSSGKVALLTAPKTIEIREFPLPHVGDDEFLLRVEGCGICGTDAHEYVRDPFKLCPVVLGHEGSGEIVALGKNISTDTAGRPVKLGDKIVTCIIPCGKCPACKNTPARTNLCENCGIYGLMPDDSTHFNGYFGEYLKVRANSTFFNVTGLSLDQRMLVEPAAVAVHAVERAKTTGLLRFDTVTLVQGCGPIGLFVMSVVRALGVENIIAIDGNDARLEFAKQFGATHTFNFTKYPNFANLVKDVKAVSNGLGAEFAFQCTGVAKAAQGIWKHIRRGGGLCEVGFFMDGGESSINHHFDLCQKEISVVGSWVYTPQDYVTTFDFLRRAKGIGLPVEALITHKYPLEKIVDAFEMNLSMQGIKVAVITDAGKGL